MHRAYSIDICEKSNTRLIFFSHCQFSLQNQIDLNKHYRGLCIAAVFPPKFLESVATSFLPNFLQKRS